MRGRNAKPGDTHVGHKGYVNEKDFDGRWVRQNRLVWTRANGPIPGGCVIHHINGDKQDNRLENLECISRSEHQTRHLATRPREWKLRSAENMRRSPRHPMSRNHCKHGHEYTPENTWYTKEGWRQCKTCHNLHYQARKHL